MSGDKIGDKIIEGLGEALEHARRPDEMAAGIIHEPGTGGIEWDRPLDEQVRCVQYDVEQPPMRWADSERPADDADHCGYVEGDPDFAEVDGTETELDMYKRFYAESARLSMEYRTMIDDLHAESRKMTGELQMAAKQRDFLIGQCSSLIERLAGAQVAAGLINMAAAQGFVQKETLPINQVLQQIAAANQGE